MGVERSTVTDIVKPLITKRVLCETEPLASPSLRSSGRPAVGLALNTHDKFFIGVNIGVRRSHVGALTADGRILVEEVFDTPGDADDALRLIRANIHDLRARAPGRCLVIGVSVPGPTCAERRRLMYAPHLGWRDIAIADALQAPLVEDGRDLTDVPVVVENDATASAMFESGTRLAHETRAQWRDFVLVRAGTGIGVGLVLDGEVYRGAGRNGGWAGEFGHMTIVADGKPCPCGNRGCWERYASAASAASLYAGDRHAARNGTHPRFVEIVARAQAGERRAQATLEQVGNYLGIGIANVMSGLGMSRVVVSGRMVHGWKFINETLQSAVKRSMAGRQAQWSVVAGKATGAGLGGAVEVAIDHYLRRLTDGTRTREDEAAMALS